MLSVFYEPTTPEEYEADVRKSFQEVQNDIMRMMADIVEKYREYNFLREIIAEIDIYGADDYLCGMKKPENTPESLINASTAKRGYDF